VSYDIALGTIVGPSSGDHRRCLALSPPLPGPCPCGLPDCEGLGPFWCTRICDHEPGNHAAGDGELVCAVWPVADAYPVQVLDKEGRTMRYDGPDVAGVLA
jgi:hypothetical protein